MNKRQFLKIYVDGRVLTHVWGSVGRFSLNGVKITDQTFHCLRFKGTDFRGCTLINCKFIYCDFDKTNFAGCKLVRCTVEQYSHKSIPPELYNHCRKTPAKGKFTGWKKVKYRQSFAIVELLIPASAKRSDACKMKCRCSKATVVSIRNLKDTKDVPVGTSWNTPSFKYRVGETVTPEYAFNDNPMTECGSGIHFFMSRKEAVEYHF